MRGTVDLPAWGNDTKAWNDYLTLVEITLSVDEYVNGSVIEFAGRLEEVAGFDLDHLLSTAQDDVFGALGVMAERALCAPIEGIDPIRHSTIWCVGFTNGVFTSRGEQPSELIGVSVSTEAAMTLAYERTVAHAAYTPNTSLQTLWLDGFLVGVNYDKARSVHGD